MTALHDKFRPAVFILALAVPLVGCDKGDKAAKTDPASPGTPDPEPATKDFGGSTNHGNISADAFTCLQTWGGGANTHHWRFKHATDDNEAKRAEIKAAIDRVFSGGQGNFPVGTILQVIPQEAMVKREPGFSPKTQDWEFFALATHRDGSTTITGRTSAPTTASNGDNLGNPAGTCIGCHQTGFDMAPSWEFTCAASPSICKPLTPGGPAAADAVVTSAQRLDMRCK